jgi:glycine hydroxymethyltransferase
MVLVDTVASHGVPGKAGQQLLDAAGITVNKNVIPDDSRGPIDPSGLRIGVPALTTRGMKEKEVRQIARWIDVALRSKGDTRVLGKIRLAVKQLCRQFPVYKKV